MVCASAIPDTLYVISGDDLDEVAGLYVTDFNESGVKEEDVWWMTCDPLCFAFPFDCAYTTT